MLKLYRYLRPYLPQSLLLLLAIATTVWTGLQLPALMANIINHGIMSGDLDYIWSTGFSMIVFALISSISAFLANFLSSWIGAHVARNLRSDFFTHVLSLSTFEVNNFSTASLITRTTSDVFQVQQAVAMTLSLGLRAPLTCVLAIGQAIATAPDMTWIIALAVGVIILCATTIMSIVTPKFKVIQKLSDRITLLARENLTGLRVVRAFNNEKLEQRRFERTNTKYARLSTVVDVIMSIENPIVSLVFNGTTLLCIWIGIGLLSQDFAYLGNMMAFMQYAIQVVLSFLFLTMLFVVLPRASVSAKRINEVLETRPKVVWKPVTAGSPTEIPSVEFEHVDFAYSGAEEKVLYDISFTAHAGETTAFIGSTGSGKSTLINLVPRFYEATAGTIKINGVNLKDYAEDDLMRRIGYVPQRGVLFEGTVRSNILFGVPEAETPQPKKSPKTPTFPNSPKSSKKPSADARLELAARVSQSAEFIAKLEKGYDSRIAQGGTNVSGGQRQRLSIARAIAKDPEIYIFDDSFSALDLKTDAKLRRDLAPITKNAVTLIVAQRISTVKTADRIIVLDKGKIVGKGTHFELLKKCKIYREIAQSQFSDAEFQQEMSQAAKSVVKNTTPATKNPAPSEKKERRHV